MSASRGATRPSASRMPSPSASAAAPSRTFSAGPSVAAGERDEVVERVVAERDAALGPERAGEAVLGVGRSPAGRRSPTSSSVSGSRRQTRIRERSAEFTSK